MVCFGGATANGAGHHIQDVTIPGEYESLMRWVYIMMIMLITGMCLCKVAVGFFILRFVQEGNERRLVIEIMSE